MKHIFYLLATILFIVNVTLSQPTGSTAGIVTAPRYVKTDTVKPTLAFNVIGNFKATGTITTPLTAGTVRSSAGGVLSVTPSDTAGLAALLAAKQNNSDTGTWDASKTFASNASNLTTGTVGTARLGSGTANSSTFLSGAQTWVTPTAIPDTNRTWHWLASQEFYNNGDGEAGFSTPELRFHTYDDVFNLEHQYSTIKAYSFNDEGNGDSGNTVGIRTGGLDINQSYTVNRTFLVNVNGNSTTENAIYVNTANNTNSSYTVFRATEDGDQQKSVNFGYNPSTYSGSGLFRAKRGILSSGNSADSGWAIYAQASGSPIIFGGGSYPGTEWTRWDDAGYFYHAGGKFALNTNGQITKLNNVATEGGFGTPAILDTVMKTNQTASIAATNFTSASTAGGMYEVTYYLTCTTASGTATVTVGVVATDGVARTQTSASVSMASTSNMTSGTFMTGLSTGSVQWQTTVTGTISSAQYKVAVVCRRVF